MFLVATPGARSAEPVSPELPEILIINSYAPGYTWSDDMLSGVLSVLREHYREIDPVIQFLDFNNFPDPARERWLIEDLADKCSIRPPGLIITLDNAAFDFSLKYRKQLGADVPLVFGGINRYVPEMIAGQRHITGVSEESNFWGTFRLMKALRPNATKVLVISNRLPSSIESRKVFESFIPGYSDRYTFEIWDDWTNEELFARLETLGDEWVALILNTTSDAAGTVNYNSASFSLALATRPRVPVFINSRPPGNRDSASEPWDCIGGGLVEAREHGAAVGQIAARILAGEDIDSIPVVRHSPQRIEVEYSQMKRFGMTIDRLPPGTHVINAPSTFYQVNRPRILLAGIAFVVLLVIIAVLSFNILRRKYAEKALRKAEEHLRHSQKLEAIGLLTGGVAHDFNNILQVIIGRATFLREGLAGADPEMVQDVESIQDAAKRAARMTHQLLAFSRQQPLQAGAVEINALVSDMAKMLDRLLGGHIELKVVPLTEPCTLMADKSKLEQVLLNLCVNARDAMPNGGRILIELKHVHLAKCDLRNMPELSVGPHLLLAVSDSGCGMPPKLMERIFDPFFTTKELGKGTGMGLAVVYGIVCQHQGSIRVYSEIGKGAVFKILLPISAPDAPADDKPDQRTFPCGSGTILLAEDDAQVRRIAVRILKENGFRLLVAADGEEAISILEKNHADIRLAILDVLMPKRNGREVCDFIQKNHSSIPVLFCSGYSAEMLPPRDCSGPRPRPPQQALF